MQIIRDWIYAYDTFILTTRSNIRVIVESVC